MNHNHQVTRQGQYRPQQGNQGNHNNNHRVLDAGNYNLIQRIQFPDDLQTAVKQMRAAPNRQGGVRLCSFGATASTTIGKILVIRHADANPEELAPPCEEFTSRGLMPTTLDSVTIVDTCLPDRPGRYEKVVPLCQDLLRQGDHYEVIGIFRAEDHNWYEERLVPQSAFAVLDTETGELPISYCRYGGGLVDPAEYVARRMELTGWFPYVVDVLDHQGRGISDLGHRKYAEKVLRRISQFLGSEKDVRLQQFLAYGHYRGMASGPYHEMTELRDQEIVEARKSLKRNVVDTAERFEHALTAANGFEEIEGRLIIHDEKLANELPGTPKRHRFSGDELAGVGMPKPTPAVMPLAQFFLDCETRRDGTLAPGLPANPVVAQAMETTGMRPGTVNPASKLPPRLNLDPVPSDDPKLTPWDQVDEETQTKWMDTIGLTEDECADAWMRRRTRLQGIREEAQRQAAEAQRIENERIAAEKAEAQRIRDEQVAAEKAAAARVKVDGRLLPWEEVDVDVQHAWADMDMTAEDWEIRRQRLLGLSTEVVDIKLRSWGQINEVDQANWVGEGFDAADWERRRQRLLSQNTETKIATAAAIQPRYTFVRAATEQHERGARTAAAIQERHQQHPAAPAPKLTLKPASVPAGPRAAWAHLVAR